MKVKITKSIEKMKEILKDKDLHLALIFVFIFGLLAHGYAFFNIIFRHDSLIMVQNDSGFQISIGRFLHWFIFRFRGNYYVPWLVGFIGLFFIGFSGYLIFKIFNIKEKWQKILIIALLTVNRIVTRTIAVYIHDIDIYMISLFFAVLGAYILIKNDGKLLKQSLSIIPFVISLGLYPAYIQVSIGILMIYIMLNLLKNEEKLDVIIKRGFTYILFLLIGLILYFIGTKLSLKVSGIEISGMYNSVGAIKNLNSLKKILSSLKITYRDFIYFYFRIEEGFNRIVLFALNILVSISGLYFSVHLIRKNKLKIKSILTLMLIFAFLPLGLNLSCFLAGGMSHMLMIYSFLLIYILYIIQLDMYCKEIKENSTGRDMLNIFKTFMLILACAVIFNNMVYANQRYYFNDQAYRNTNNVFNRMIMKIEEIEEYEQGKTPVYLVNYPLLADSEKYGDISVSYRLTYNWFMKYAMQNYMNLNMNGEEELSKEELEYIKTMSVYPKKDSVKYKDGKVFVKFGN